MNSQQQEKVNTQSPPHDPGKVLTGTVLWFNNGKGFGFIRRDLGGDLFVHFSEIISKDPDEYKTLKENDRVEFTEAESTKHAGRLQAFNVRVIG